MTAGFVLRVAFAGYAIAAAAWAWGAHTPVFSFLFLTCDLSEAACVGGLRAVAVGCGAAAGLLWSRWYRWAGGFLAVWALAQVAAAMHGGEWLPWVKPFAHAVRWVGPLALAAGLTVDRRAQVALLWAAAATFAGHGASALALKGEYLDYLFSAFALIGERLSEEQARGWLTAIGAVDLVVAAAALVLRRPAARWVLGWMALWGMATAAMRVVHGGVAFWPEWALRLPNGLVPLAVLVAWQRPLVSSTRGARSCAGWQ